MAKKKKRGNKNELSGITQKLILVTAILNLTNAAVNFLKTLLNIGK